MNKHLILILLVPLLVLAKDHEIFRVGMKAQYTKKALEQHLVYPPMNIIIDNVEDGRLLMSSTNIMVDSPHLDDIEFNFDQENNLITVTIKDQHFNFSSLVTLGKSFLKIKGDVQVAGKINEIKITFGLTTLEGQYTRAPVIMVKQMNFDLKRES